MITIDNLVRDLDLIKAQSPLVHNITNFVVMNNTANALLALGASPVMAHALEEVEEMASICSSLVLNIGTLSPSWITAMEKAALVVKKRGVNCVFDPVGAGATSYRSETCKELINKVSPTVIRGNGSEIMALLNSQITTKGVDSSASSNDAVDSAKELARQSGAVVVISGPTDYITNGKEVIAVKNGAPMMTKVTGLGCTATAVVGAFVAVNNNQLEAAAHAMAAMGIAGEIAAEKAEGPGSMQMIFLDELYKLDRKTIEKRLIL